MTLAMSSQSYAEHVAPNFTQTLPNGFFYVDFYARTFGGPRTCIVTNAGFKLVIGFVSPSQCQRANELRQTGSDFRALPSDWSYSRGHFDGKCYLSLPDQSVDTFFTRYIYVTVDAKHCAG